MTNLIHFIRLLQRNLKWMVTLSILTAAIVFWFTRDMPKEYQSEAEIFTGITSGLSIDNVEGTKMDFFAANNAFDNLINIIQSRQTQQEVGMRLLALHIMMDEPRLEWLSEKSYANLNEWLDNETRENLRVKNDTQATYENILSWYQKEFHSEQIGQLFNSSSSPYSDKAIKTIQVQRLQNSDLIRISYTWTDPAIAQQTLEILNEVFIRLVAEVKVAQTNDIVEYFREQVRQAEERLGLAEDELKAFRTENRVINYGEQTKSIAMMKEYMEDEYQKELAARASANAAVEKLEVQLSVNKQMLQYSEDLLEKRAELADINSKIAVLEVYLNDEEMLSSLRRQADELKAQISRDLFNRMEYARTTEGVPVTKLLEEWLEYSLALDRIDARIKVYENRKVYFNDLYDEFSVVGSTIGKIEREIGIEEKNYLELLHSLNLALMRLSSETLASDGLQVTVEPYFPLSPLPSKRFLLVALAFVLAFLLPYIWAVVKDLLDLSIKTGDRLSKFSGAEHIGSLPIDRLIESQKSVDAEKLTARYMRLIWSRIKSKKSKEINGPLLISVMSLRRTEGKSHVANKLKEQLTKQELNVSVIHPGTEEYQVTENLSSVSQLTEISSEDHNTFDVVILEVPALIEDPYPSQLLEQIDIHLIVSWAGRIWGTADSKKLDELTEFNRIQPLMILNGVDMEELESTIGELPKNRSKLRTYLKRYIQLQFKSSVASA